MQHSGVIDVANGNDGDETSVHETTKGAPFPGRPLVVEYVAQAYLPRGTTFSAVWQLAQVAMNWP